MRAFSREDFFLAIMTETKSKGESVLDVDSTHNASRYNKIKLTTLLILGPHDRCMPVAFLITTQESEKVLSLFFAAIRRFIAP